MNWPSFLKLNKEHITSHLQYKHSGTFANRKYEELSYPKNPKMCDPTVVTLLKMQPHYSQSSHKNATPSSGTSPLASYKEVPLPPGTRDKIICYDCQATSLVKPAETLACDWLNTNERRQMMTSIITLPRTIYRRNIKSIGTLRHVLRILQTTINDSL